MKKIRIILKKYKKFPRLSQWEKFLSSLSKKEERCLLLFFVLAVASFIFLNLNFYLKNTEVQPRTGGRYVEGLIGQPRFINPIYLTSNDVDRDLVEILFSGLLKYDEKGKLKNDLAESFEIKEEGRVWEFKLKDNIFWHDGKPITPEDVVFTLKLVQSPQYQSPQRLEWLGVQVEVKDEKTVRFSLQKKYFHFLETVAHLKPLAKHIFENLSPENLPWRLISKEHLIGSGPFKFKELKEGSSGYIKELIFEKNSNCQTPEPFLKEISFRFFKDPQELILAARNGEIDGFSLSDLASLETFGKGAFKSYQLSLPRYFAVFFNFQNSKILKNNKIRETLSLALNKKAILEKVFFNQGKEVNSPVLPDYYNLNLPGKIYSFDSEEAKRTLEKEGFQYNLEGTSRQKIIIKESSPIFKSNLTQGSKGKEVEELQKCLAQDKEVYPEGEITGFFGQKTKKAVIRFQEKYAAEILTPQGLKSGTGDVKAGTRKKLQEICFPPEKEILSLKFSLTTVEKFPLTEIAEILKKNWQEIGVEVEIKKVSISELETDILKKRDFETLLFGESLGSLLDPFPFWHSSQKEYPGLNITQYQSKTADKLLEEAREIEDEKERKEKLEKFQDVLLEDIPAIFLVRPDYIYFLSPKIKGFSTEKITEPSKRFAGIENWYIKTRRVWQ
ncbi:MAG: ABC transporter substrate-binding protein [Patescibacteria group bacterium]|nr:ABC transporter substrate-binding protein [Patescibacteria group bacterium]